MIICNAFSPSMLDGTRKSRVYFSPLTIGEARRMASIGSACGPAWPGHTLESAVGHADTAAQLTHILGVPVEARRASVQLVPGDQMLVAQYTGPRLPEGTTELPAGAGFAFWQVSLLP